MHPVTTTTKPPKSKSGKPMPYFCSNHTLPKTYQYHYPTKLEHGGGYRWLVHPFFTIRGDVVERVTNPIRGRQQNFTKEQHLMDVVFPRIMTRDDLRPVLDHKLVREAPEDKIYKPKERLPDADNDCLENTYWNLITLPPDPIGGENRIIYPGECKGEIDPNELPNIMCFEELEGQEGVVLVKVAPVILGWCLFRFQDFDTNLEWWVSLKEAGLYLKEGGEIKAIVKLLQLYDTPRGVK